MVEEKSDMVKDQIQTIEYEHKKWDEYSKTSDYRMLSAIAKPMIAGLIEIIKASPVSSRYVNVPLDKINLLKAQATGELLVWEMILNRPKELSYLVKTLKGEATKTEERKLKSLMPLLKYQ